MTVREQIVNSLDKFLANCKNTFIAIANVVDNCASTSTTMPLSANQGKVLQDQITELNTDSVGNSQIAFVTFDNYGDNYWISSPIPCFMADRLNIMLSENVKNTTSSVNAVISSGIFEIRKCKNCFYLLTNNTETAGYIFSTLHPNRVWEVYYNVS